MTVRLYLPFNKSPKVSLRQKNNEYAHRKSAAKFFMSIGYLMTGNTERIPGNDEDKKLLSILVR